MSKLEEIRSMVSELFGKCEEKEIIEQAAVVNQKLSEAEAEEQQLINDKAEIMKSYKDLVIHTSFKKEPEPDCLDKVVPVSFEDALDNFLNSNSSAK